MSDAHAKPPSRAILRVAIQEQPAAALRVAWAFSVKLTASSPLTPATIRLTM
jgi:hypothetical protein